MATVSVRVDFCKGCRLCVKVCPKHMLQLTKRLNAMGVQPVDVTGKADDCAGCMNCVLMCPEAAIEIENNGAL